MLNSTSTSRVLALLTAVALFALAFAAQASAAGTAVHTITTRKAIASHRGVRRAPAGKQGSHTQIPVKSSSGNSKSSSSSKSDKSGQGNGKKKTSSTGHKTEVPPHTTTPPLETPAETTQSSEPISVAPPVGLPPISAPPVTVPTERPSAADETPAPEETKTTTPPAEETSSSSTASCPIGASASLEPIPMTMPGCRVVASDTAAKQSPTSFWGALQCMSGSDYSWGQTGGDTHPAANGVAQGNEDFRQVTTYDGDEFWGERCELGEDDWRHGPTAYYREGDHYVTYISEKLPSNFPLATKTWQTVMQMKQAEPSNVGGGAPIIEMEARENKWVISDNWVELFSFPAKANTWTRFAWDVNYSKSASKGSIQVSADLNGDGDFNDPGERSPTFHLATLKTEINEPGGTGEGLIAPGEAVPSHLRAGIYHNPEIPCPASGGGCSVQVDNVQVMAAP